MSRPFEATGLQEIENALGKIGAEQYAPKCIEAATPIVEKAYKAKLRRHKKTGAMHTSVKTSTPKENKRGWFSVVRPTGRDEKWTRNMAKACYLEYGVRSHNIARDPMRSETMEQTKDQVIQAMWKTFNEEIDKAK